MNNICTKASGWPWTLTMWLAAFHSCLFHHVYAWYDYYIIIRYTLLPNKFECDMWLAIREKTLMVSELHRCTCNNKDMLLHVWDHKKPIISKLCHNRITRIKMWYNYILHETTVYMIVHDWHTYDSGKVALQICYTL